MPDEKPIKINQAKLDDLGQVLFKQLEEQIHKRKRIEDRWLEDVRQYHGKYAKDMADLLKKQADETGSSQIFVNLTRPICDKAEARFSEMLFPTDDRNWLIKPTPDPDLGVLANDPSENISAAVRLEMEQAQDAADAMQRTIEDQLTESDYSGCARDVIRDGVRLGTGIIRGPVVQGRESRRWQPVAGGTQELIVKRSREPGVKRVSPWDFYPDMSANRIDDAEFVFERELLTRKRLLALRNDSDGYIKSQIKRVLEDDTHKRKGSETASEDILQRLREIAGVFGSNIDNRYEVWTYTGCFDADILEAAGIGREDARDNPLNLVEGIVQFVGQTVIKVALLPLETDDYDYSVFNWIEADASIFGYGIPYVLRAPQEVVNKSWRAMLDNAALSVGSQIVADRKNIMPADGKWSLSARKLWWKTEGSVPINQAFATFDIDNNQPALAEIFALGRELAREESGTTEIESGEVGDTPDQTATQSAMRMTAAGVVKRRIVKQWDDGITKPLIQRFYDYNMQYNPDPSIKGDFEIDARGTSALLVKEQQAQAMLLLMQFANDPTFGPMLKSSELLRRAVEAQRIPADDLVRTDEEIEALQQQPAPPDIEQQKLDAELQMHREDILAQAEQREMDRELKILELALKQEVSIEEVQAQLAKTRMQEDTKRSEQQLKLITGSGI